MERVDSTVPQHCYGKSNQVNMFLLKPFLDIQIANYFYRFTFKLRANIGLEGPILGYPGRANWIQLWTKCGPTLANQCLLGRISANRG